MKKFKHGVVVGKFCPLHAGHQFLIDTAWEQCEEVMIISYTKRDLGYSAEKRFDWLQHLWPKACIVVIKDPDLMPDDDEPDEEHRLFCAGLMYGANCSPDAVFTSEEYGEGFAEVLSDFFDKNVQHVLVDLHRTEHPISGTLVRSNPELYKKFLHEYVRENL